MSDSDFWNQIEQVVARLKQSHRLLFITGAGISADSGLPTYRGISGLYENKQTDEGMPIESALSGSMFQSHPAITWKYLSQIEETCRGKAYNRAHEVLAEMEKYFDHVCVLTQNVDGFHQQAGSKNVIDIHGNLHDLICERCDFKERVPDYTGLEIPPVCPRCGGMLRPDVVLFEEALSNRKLRQLSEEMENGFDLVFSVGTSSVFPYIARPVIAAFEANVATVEINPDQTRVSDFCHLKIKEKAATTMNAIWVMFRQ